MQNQNWQIPSSKYLTTIYTCIPSIQYMICTNMHIFFYIALNLFKNNNLCLSSDCHENFVKPQQCLIYLRLDLKLFICTNFLAYMLECRLLRGHSTTTWTEFCHFRTPLPCVDSFYTLSVDKNRHFLTPLILSTQLLNGP